MSTRPVVIYGANGFSGRLIAEFLREYNLPFVAAGRDATKIRNVMDHVPGIETADYEIAETAGSVNELSKLFSGAKVVCNTAGPFIYDGPKVIEAALNAGCHYVDIGGEQAWALEVAENWGPKFAHLGLLAAPGTAFMSAVSDAAARLCLEHGAIDTIETVTMFKGIPTFGSTQTIFAVIPTDAHYLEQNRYTPWPRAMRYDVSIPGYIQSQLALAWADFPNRCGLKIIPRSRMCARSAVCSIGRLWKALRPPRSCLKNRSGLCRKASSRNGWLKWRTPYRLARHPGKMRASNVLLT